MTLADAEAGVLAERRNAFTALVKNEVASRAAAESGRAQLRALTRQGGAVWDAESAKMQTAGTPSGNLWGNLWVRVHFAGA